MISFDIVMMVRLPLMCFKVVLLSCPPGRLSLTLHKPRPPSSSLGLCREDLGFRWVSEQVSHHPPVSAFHAEGLKEDFLFHGSIYPKLKFWGKSVEAEPKGVITLELPK